MSQSLQSLASRSRVSTLSRSRRPMRPQAFLSFLQSPASKQQTREERKEELLDLIKPLNRGVSAGPDDIEAVEAAAKALERLNPNPKSLSSPLVNGKWELLYTTSTSVNGTNRPALLRPSGPIYQTIDAVNGKARNRESAPFFNQVAADLTPLTASKVKVQFTQFKLLGLIPITAPDSAVGELDITYVDEDLRVSRGDKGNLFVLKMVDRDAKP